MTTTKLLTGEEARRLWFEGVMRWEYRIGSYAKADSVKRWTNGTIVLGELPAIDKSLDLQEEWVWPELRKKSIIDSKFYDGGEFVLCEVSVFMGDGLSGMAQAPTKAMAQLLAALKAMEEK